MGISYFTKEEIEWVRENKNNFKNDKEVVKQFNLTFKDRNFNSNSLHYICRKYNIKSNKYSSRFIYTKEINDFIINNIDNYSYDELLEILKEKYDYTQNKNALMKHCTENLKLFKKEKTKFLPKNQLGHEKKLKSGAVYVKVNDEIQFNSRKNRDVLFNYRRKTNILYEQYHNVKVNDDTHIVIQLDDNMDNFEKDNLFLITRQAYSVYLGYYNGAYSEFWFENPYLRKLHLMNIELDLIVKNERKELNNNGKQQ